MSTCVPTPVSTAFSTVIENSITTTYSLSTSTAPPVVTTHVDPYCENEAVVFDSTMCLKTGTRTGTETLQREFLLLITSTLPSCVSFFGVVLIFIHSSHSMAATNFLTLTPSFSTFHSSRNVAASDVVYTVTYETAVPVTNFVPINTIYGGCSDSSTNPSENNPGAIGGGSGPGPSYGSNSNPNDLGSNFNSGNTTNSGSNGNNGGSISVPPGHLLVTSSVLVFTTGPPTTSVIPSVITLPNGQVTTTSILTVITPKPSQVFVPTTALVEATGISDPGSGSVGNLGVIVGAVIGGFIGLCLMILAWWYVRYATIRCPPLPPVRD